MTEQDAIISAQRGDPTGFDFLYRAHHRSIERLCRKVSGRSNSEDLVQDTFMKALMHIQKFKGQSSFRTWLGWIAYHSCLKYNRRSATIPVVSIEDLPASAFMSADLLDADMTLKSLPTEKRRAIAGLAEGKTVAEIAEEDGVGPSTIYARVSSAKRAVQEALT